MHIYQVRVWTVLLVTALACGSGLDGRCSLLEVTSASDDLKSARERKGVVAEASVRDLIKQLGDASYDKREAADKRLAAIGEPAWDLLHEAALASADAETGHRAALLARAIGKKLFIQVRQFDGHERGKQGVTRLAVTSDGRRIVSVGTDAVRCWDIATGKQTVKFDDRKGAQCYGFAISADGSRDIVGCGGKQAHVFDLATGNRIQTFPGHKGMVWGVALTADGKHRHVGFRNTATYGRSTRPSKRRFF